jgi:transcriptional regulator with XRE-family HTH domain
MVGTAVAADAGAPVGALLREWRQRRRYSQLALALEAGISARHLSFLETGRAAPSREMLDRLAEQLQVPARHRNALFLAAGYAPRYRERAIDDAALAGVRRAAELMLASLEPCPALLIDRHWTLLAANRALGLLLEGVDAELLRPPVNALRVSLHPRGVAPRILNLAEWRGHVLHRLRRDAEAGADPVLAALHDELRAYPAAGLHRPPQPDAAPAVAIPLRLATEHGTLSFLSTTTVFGTALDPAAAELAIESFLPADEETADALRRIAAQTRVADDA